MPQRSGALSGGRISQRYLAHGAPFAAQRFRDRLWTEIKAA